VVAKENQMKNSSNTFFCDRLVKYANGGALYINIVQSSEVIYAPLQKVRGKVAGHTADDLQQDDLIFPVQRKSIKRTPSCVASGQIAM
jgi:hypothetical protein